MMKRVAFAACAAVLLVAVPVRAQCGGCEKAGGCDMKEGQECSHQEGVAQEGDEAMCDSDVTCDGDVVRYEGTDLPRIGFKVGEKITCCMKSATEMAEGDTTKILYVVGDKTYRDLGKAKVARTAELNTFYEDLFAVKYAVGDSVVCCSTMAKQLSDEKGKAIEIKLASFPFATDTMATDAAAKARAAGDKVQMKWMVGEKVFAKPEAAEAVAAAQGGKLQFCIGDKQTECPITASMMLAEARIQVALTVLGKTSGKVL